MFPEGGKNRNEGSVSDSFFEDDDGDVSLQDSHSGEELDGRLDSNPSDEEKLAHTVLNVDTNSIDDGMIVEEAFNQNIGAFVPDLMFAQMVKDFKNAKKLYGETIIRELTGYDPNFVDKNVKIPEFQRELKKRLKDSVQHLKDEGIITGSGIFTKDALLTVALFLIDENYQDEKKNPSVSFGEKVHFTGDVFGEKAETRPFRKGDHYKDVAIKESIKQALRRGRRKLLPEDLHTYERESKQRVNIIYALDISGSMKGDKLRLAKKAGVALAHKAIKDTNQIGLVLFGSDIEKKLSLTKDLFSFISPLTKITPRAETNIALAISESAKLLESAQGIKHILLLTDGLHTTDAHPEKVVLEEVAKASAQDISISVVGISLDDLGLELAKSIVDHSGGRLHGVAESSDIGGVIIADYEKLL